jgi:hypothetical protein
MLNGAGCGWIVGTTSDTITYGALPPITPAGGTDVFVVRLDGRCT